MAYFAVMDELLSIGRDSVNRFLQRWCGSTGVADAIEAGMEPAVPPELAEWHAAVARVGAPVIFQDHPVALPDLAPAADGMLTFWRENQHGYYWAIHAGRSDRQVFCTESGSRDWHSTGQGLGQFLLHCTVREAIIGSKRKFTTFIDKSMSNDALQSFLPLNFSALSSEESETRLWCSADALARLAVPLVGYEQPGEQLWMLTISVQHDSTIQDYASRFGHHVSEDVDPPLLEDLDEPPPF
ncbi:hypothetical protein GCM10010502_00700 [Kitasatospora aureofaciens]|uniref:Uncharacterized protein n=2 Tax=Kitasatospora aureofaciens TaxID=1894 RepID=A0A8H9HGL9_KITAU|nr:hypothetical protein GCM10010502_00700 [Kitasatospora aureofaciens]